MAGHAPAERLSAVRPAFPDRRATALGPVSATRGPLAIARLEALHYHDLVEA